MPSDFTPNNVWGSSSANGEEELILPSGQTCRAIKISVESMIQTGILADADVLTALVSKHIRKVKGGNGKADGQTLDEKGMLSDPKALQSIIGLTDKLMPHILISPSVQLHYTETTVGKTTVTKRIPEDERNPATIYTDMIGLEDKMFLFDWAAGGLQAMTNFRPGPTTDVGGVVPRKGPGKSAKRRPGGK